MTLCSQGQIKDSSVLFLILELQSMLLIYHRHWFLVPGLASLESYQWNICDRMGKRSQLCLQHDKTIQTERDHRRYLVQLPSQVKVRHGVGLGSRQRTHSFSVQPVSGCSRAERCCLVSSLNFSCSSSCLLSSQCAALWKAYLSFPSPPRGAGL